MVDETTQQEIATVCYGEMNSEKHTQTGKTIALPT